MSPSRLIFPFPLHDALPILGDEVYFVFSFDALRHLARDSFGLPRTEKEMAESARSEGLGVPAPMRMLQEARRSEEHTSELQSQSNLVCRLLLEKKKEEIFDI